MICLGFWGLIAVSCPCLQAQGNEEAEDEPPFAEQLNRYIHSLAIAERESREQRMAAVIADLDRVCQLTAEQTRQLELAAKGAIDRGLDGWRQRVEDWVRRKAQKVPGDPDGFFAALGTIRFGSHEAHSWREERQTVWRQALQAILTESQRDAYRADLKERYAYKHDALARVVTAELDLKLRFSAGQRLAVQAMFQQACATHWETLEQHTGSADQIPYGHLLALLFAVDEEQVRGILSATQWKLWADMRETRQRVWQSIEELTAEEKVGPVEYLFLEKDLREEG